MREAFQALRAILLCLWPVTTLAAGGSIGSTLGAVTAGDWVAIVALSGVSGMVALLHRVRRSFEYEALVAAGRVADVADQQLIDWRVFAAVHMAGALFVGFVAFLLGSWMEANSYLQAAFISLSSWGGAKVADRWADAFSDRFTSIIGQKAPS